MKNKTKCNYNCDENVEKQKCNYNLYETHEKTKQCNYNFDENVANKQNVIERMMNILKNKIVIKILMTILKKKCNWNFDENVEQQHVIRMFIKTN